MLSVAARSARCSRRTSRRSTTSKSGRTTSRSAHVDAINRDGLRLTGAGEVVGPSARDDATRRSCLRATSGSSRRRRCTPTRAITATAHAFADGCVATVQNGIGNEEVLARARRARDSRHDVPGREDHRARRRAVGRQGRHDASGRSRTSRRRSRRSSGSPTRARVAACRRRRSLTRAARSGAR